MLDDLELPQVQAITTLDRRALTEHHVPGMSGSMMQDMGRKATRLILWGIASGSQATDFVKQLTGRFQAGEPMPFIADIVADAQIEQMVIDDLHWRELAGRPECFVYVLRLCEFIEPVEPVAPGLLDDNIFDEARNLIDDLVDGLDLGFGLPTGLERFVGPLDDLLKRLQQFASTIG